MLDGRISGSRSEVRPEVIAWWARRDSNPRPTACKAAALTAAPLARAPSVLNQLPTPMKNGDSIFRRIGSRGGSSRICPAWNGVATSSSPSLAVSPGDEDIAAPIPFSFSDGGRVQLRTGGG